jgi:hypothetical protein
MPYRPVDSNWEIGDLLLSLLSASLVDGNLKKTISNQK